MKINKKAAGTLALAALLTGGCLCAASAKSELAGGPGKYTFGNAKKDVPAADYDVETGIGINAIDGSLDNVTPEKGKITAKESFTFKVNMPNGNYEVTAVTDAEKVISEMISSPVDFLDDTGAPASYQPPKDKDTNLPLIGITKNIQSAQAFQVAVCDGALDLTFVYADKDITLSYITIKTLKQEKHTKPFLLAVGDSTTRLRSGDKHSWGDVIDEGQVNLPASLGGFYNGGCSGADDISYYCNGYLESVLLRVSPGDIVTVNMGINQAKKYTVGNITVNQSDSRAAMMPLMQKYYIEGILQRGGIPVITTITARGPYDKSGTPEDNGGLFYNVDTPVTADGTIAGGISYNAGQTIPANTWNNSRHSNTYNIHLYSMANNYKLQVIDLGIYGEKYYTALTADSLAAFNKAQSENYATVFDMVKEGLYADQNHYHATLGIIFAQYMLDNADKILSGTYKYLYPDYQPVYLKTVK